MEIENDEVDLNSNIEIHKFQNLFEFCTIYQNLNSNIEIHKFLLS